MKTNLLRCLVIASAVLSVGVAACHAGTVLRNKFTPGEVRHIVMNQDQEIIIHIQGQDATQNVTQNMIVDMTSKAETVDVKGNASISMLMDRVRMTTKGTEGVIFDYDSTSKDKPKGMAKMMALIFEPLTKKPITMKESPLGKISAVKMPEGSGESLKKAQTAIAQVGGTVPSEQELADSIKEAGIVFPEESLTEGKTWTTETTKTFEGMGKQKVKTTYRYEGKENKDGKDLDKISITEVLNPAGDNKKSDIKSYSTEGTLYFDNAAGTMIEHVVNTKMTIEKGPQAKIEVKLVNTTKLVPEDSKAEKN